MTPRLLLIGMVFALPVAGRAETLHLTDGSTDLAVGLTATAPEAPVVGGEADLKTRVLDLDTSLRLAVQTGSIRLAQDGWTPFAISTRSGAWTTGQFGLGAKWAPTTLATVQLTADGQTRSEFDPADPIWNTSTDRYVRSSQATARAEASLVPASRWTLRIGGETSLKSVRSSNMAAAGPEGSDLLTTGVRRAYTAVQWKVMPRLALEGGGQAEAIGVAWAGTGEKGGAYGYLEPRAAATLDLWAGASWRLGVERAVSPVREDQFLAFAQAAGQTAARLFEPGREWRYQASLKQALPGDLAFKATLTRARLQSVTELGPVGIGQAPMDIGGGERRQLEASLAAPAVALFGLPPLAVKVRGAWRTSEVVDPFTGELRRLSGEAPYDAELILSPATPLADLHWGVSAHAQGGASDWRMDEVATRSGVAGLSGFVAYKPGPLAVRVQLDNLVGGSRAERDVYFAGSRLSNTVERVSESRGADRAVRITLSRSL